MTWFRTSLQDIPVFETRRVSRDGVANSRVFESNVLRRSICLEHTRGSFPNAWVCNPDEPGNRSGKRRKVENNVSPLFSQAA